MEATRAEKARLGLFLLVTVAALLASVAFLVGKKLTARTDTYFTRLSESVTGLSPGTPVKQNGVDIGQVVSITTDSGDIQKAAIHFKVMRGTPMKTDMVASLGSYGITGLKYLEIMGGSYAAANIPVGGEVPSGMSMMGRLTLRADSIALKVDRLLGNAIAITEAQNRKSLDKLMQSSAALSEALDSLVRDVQQVRPGRRVEKILGGAEAAVEGMRDQVRKTDIAGTLNEYRKAAEDIQKAAKSLDATVLQSQQDLAVVMGSLKETMRNMSTFSRELKENPSLLIRGEDKQERRR
jgi:phospholipid/cholesterol/gamma-HCH transport system substrate-binding protein